MIEIIWVTILLGMVSGLLAGLFGIGGGLIIVPVLVIMFKAQGLPVELVMLMAVATIVGIDGGTLTVPYLVHGQMPMRNAVAVASACGLPIAVAGTISYAVLGWHTL